MGKVTFSPTTISVKNISLRGNLELLISYFAFVDHAVRK